MEQHLKTERSIVINSSAQRIWDVLTNFDKVKLYLFGSEVATDWKVGSPVTFSREFNGKKYQDKGHILEINPEKLLRFTFWNSQEGYPDIPQNYSIISYTLEKGPKNSITLTYLREKIPIAFEQKNQELFLPGMLAAIKSLAEQD